MHKPNNQKKRWSELFERWADEKLLPTGSDEKLRQRLQIAVNTTPWYVRFLVGVGAWFAAIFFLIFLGVTNLYKNETVSLVTGILACLVAVNLLRQKLGDFVEQLALAASLVGQGLILFGVSKWFIGPEGFTRFLVAAICLQILMFVINTSVVLRFFSILFGSLALFGLIHHKQPHAIHAVVIVYAALVSACWLLRSQPTGTEETNGFGEGRWLGTRHTFWSVLVSGFAVSLVVVLIFSAMPEASRKFRVLSWIPSAVGIGIVWLAVAWRLLQRAQKSVDTDVLVIGGGMLLFCAFSYNAPGVLVAGLFGTLGFAERDRFLMGLGVVALLFFLSAYYYNMQITLLAKSFALMIPGLILLGLYRYLRSVESSASLRPTAPSVEEKSHA
jgi:hypothetical protein